MIFFGQATTAFDVGRLSDYGVMGIMLACLMYAINNIGNALKSSLETRALDYRNDLLNERKARQDFEVRISEIMQTLIKSVADLSSKVGEKRESIDQLTSVIRELFDLVHDVRREAVAKNGGKA